jgi:hypothetical protein
MVDFLKTNFPGEDIRGGFMPDGESVPDRIVAVAELPGDPPPAETFVGFGKGPKLNMEVPALSIRCREAKDCYEDSRELAEDMYQFLNNQVGVILGGVRYSLIEAIAPPFLVGSDSSARWIIGVDIKCWKKKSI